MRASGRPAGVCTLLDGAAHGSLRAPEGYDLGPMLDLAQPYLLSGGGHRAAAGISFEANRFRFVQQTLCKGAADQAAGRLAAPVLIDGAPGDMPAPGDMARLEPFGQGFPTPLARVAGRRAPGGPPRPAVQPLSSLADRAKAGRALIAIGSSTGGTEALRQVFERIPGNLPPIVVVQHMLPGFTEAFADRLDRTCQARVKVAADGEPLKAGGVYLAPSDAHLSVARHGAGLLAMLQPGERVSGHLPSVDVLFHSVAATSGAHAMGVILTGMGEDGARGLLQMRQKGARTVGQDEATCVVYGMPRAAFMRGAVEEQAPLLSIPDHLVAWCGREA